MNVWKGKVANFLDACTSREVEKECENRPPDQLTPDAEALLKCKDCSEEFTSNTQLVKHKSKHTEKRQYNCDDCAFQGENRVELKKHLQRTKHCPSDLREVCYTCKEEFQSYWHLMNHRKKEHPSNKICRYFKDGCCEFTDEECWYRHLDAHQNKTQDILKPHLSCQLCNENFGEKSDLMKHKKEVHRGNVPKCRDFMLGKCTKSKSCWFKHDDDQPMEIDDEDQDFCEDQDKTPPDHVNLMMKMIKKLILQVELLEKQSLPKMQ